MRYHQHVSQYSVATVCCAGEYPELPPHEAGGSTSILNPPLPTVEELIAANAAAAAAAGGKGAKGGAKGASRPASAAASAAGKKPGAKDGKKGVLHLAAFEASCLERLYWHDASKALESCSQEWFVVPIP
jgi:hypothetical protein